MEKKRSAGLIIVGTLITLLGVTNLFVLISANIPLPGRLTSICFNIYLTICGVGILLLANWARVSVIIIAGLSALFASVSIIPFFKMPSLGLPAFAATVLVCLVVLYFLTRPKVREQFK